ncbi:MFS transporter [Streptomyces sp. NA04227]|uniref:MFS transporter n=1 Tax=Streptomyces sp. NA04227 TaxID=2742136 RepID=UPI001591EEA3|nr:MFS transporter [Streptomyces sp. NA04227]QKW05810.1 MFS transporter [Streptomyces sp. NA04227]
MTGTIGRVLRDRNARLFLASVLVSGFGSTAMWLTAGVWVKDLTGSDSLAALCAFALWAPALVGPLLGGLADRTRRRPLLITGNLVLALVTATLCVVGSRLWFLFAVLVLYGALGLVLDAAEAALVASVVDEELLGQVNGLRMSASEGTKLLAPLVGAGLYAAYGIRAVAVLDALSFLLGALLVLALRTTEPRPERGGAGRLAGTLEGGRYLWRSAALRPLVLAAGAVMLLAGVNGALVFAVVDDGLGRPPSFAGVLYAAQGAGSIVCGLASGALLRRLGERGLCALGAAVFSVALALRAVPSVEVSLLCSAAIGAGLPCVLVAALTAVQKRTPNALLGRAAATASSAIFLPNAVALGLGSGLVAVVDHRILLPLLGCLGLCCAAALLRLRAPAAEHLAYGSGGARAAEIPRCDHGDRHRGTSG